MAEVTELEEEISSVTSIFDEVTVQSNSSGQSQLIYSTHPNTVTVTLTGNYPNDIPAISVPSHLQAVGLLAHLISVTTPLIGSPMLYSIFDAAKDWINENETKIQHSFQNTKKDVAVCKFFLQGKCRFGVHCINLHPGAPSALHPEVHSSPGSETKYTKASNSKSKQVNETNKDSSPSKKQQKPSAAAAINDEEESGKKERMRTATEVISRITWDPDLPSEHFVVGYLDRFIGIQEKGFKEFSWEDIASVGADVLAVPKHRIQYFKYKGQIVWDKRSQTDDFFGSRGGKTIDMFIDKPTDDAANDSSPKTDNDTEHDQDDTNNNGGLEIDLIADDEQPLAHRHGNQPRPTHFVCLRITDEEVKARVKKVIDHVTKLNPQLAEGIIKAPSLHVTLCMIQLLNDEQIETAKRVFKTSQLQFLSVLPPCVKIEFTGVDNFRERLIYVKMKPLPGLSKLVYHLIEQFQLASLKTPGNHEEYTPHITLIKLSRPMQRHLDTKLINPECYRPFVTKNLGCQAVTSLHLCSMHAPAQSDGFYLKYATITNSLISLPDQFCKLVEGKLQELKEKAYIEDSECQSLIENLHQAVTEEDEAKFDNVIKELVHANEEVRMFESGNTSVTTVIILRGLPGSGKSHLSSQCQENLLDPSQVAVVSADQFFTKGSDYHFNPVIASKAHQQCIVQFLEALCSRKKLVIIDNTNSQRWEYTIYTYLCQVMGIQCHILEIPCPSSSIGERFRCRNQHKIQPPAFGRMVQRWQEDTKAVMVPPSLTYPKDWPHPQPFSILKLCEGLFTPLPEVIKESPSLVAVYSGIFLTTKSQWEVLSTFPPSHNDIHSSHVTLVFSPSVGALEKLPVGKKVQVKITGHAMNAKSQACAVEIPLQSENKMPHITISTAEGVNAKSANIMLQNQVVRSCDTKLVEGVVGVVVRQATEEEKNGEELDGDKLASMAYYTVTSSSDLKAILPKLLNNSSDPSSTTPEGSKVESTGIVTGEQKITKLYVFDFDGTLVIPPGPFDGRKMYEQETGKKWPHKGWLGWPESLLPPMKTLPGPALVEFRNHINRAGSYTIVLTGRVENTKPGLLKVLENFQISPDKIYLKPDITDESTAMFKSRTMKQLLETDFRDVTLVKFWDDMPENLWAMKWLSQSPAMSNVQFDIIDATEMNITSSVSKHGKKFSHSAKADKSDIKHGSVLQECLAVRGCLPNVVYPTAVQEGIEFIANQFSKVLGYEGNPLNLLYLFGSYPLQRVSDVDMCLIAPNTQTQIDWIEKMALQLQECGLKYVHVGHSSRCPRLKIMLMYLNASPIEYDIVVALVPKESVVFTNQGSSPLEQIPASKVAELRKPGDNVSKVALSGPLFLQKIETTLNEYSLSLEAFGALVEMMVQIMVARREKGNAYHCMRTFHIVQLLVEFIQQNGSASDDRNCDILFKRFIGFVSELKYEQFEKLFGEFVPEAYIPRITSMFKECSRIMKPTEPVSMVMYESLLRRSEFPLENYIPIDIKIFGKNSVLKWKAGIIVEARLPSYIRQIISHGLDVRPDGNVANAKKFSFAVPSMKSAKDTLQQILRPFWVELADLRKQEGLTIQLNFDSPTSSSATSAKDASINSTTVGANKDSKESEILDQLTQFASSKDSPKQLHLPSTLTSHARLLVHEAAERLGLLHASVGTGKNRHVVLEKR